MTIAFFETQDWEQKYLAQKLSGHELLFLEKAALKPEPEVEVLCNFVSFPADKEALKNFPNLKYITTRSTGYDHIDLKACAERGILASNVPTYGENTVAEFTFALMLALCRKIYPALQRVKREGRFSSDGLQGFDLKGKTLGVVGTGHIGAHVIRVAKGFEMNVVAYDPYPKNQLAAEYGFTYLELNQLLPQADIVTLHVPYLPATHHLINQEKFSFFKKGSLLINTSRGALLETQSLITALKNGTLAGAALDVLEEEGFVKEEASLLYQSHPNEDQLKTVLADHELMKMENVLITPHNAFNTREAVERILEVTAQNIKSFAAGKPENLVH